MSASIDAQALHRENLRAPDPGEYQGGALPGVSGEAVFGEQTQAGRVRLGMGSTSRERASGAAVVRGLCAGG
jgi:hypothetical protein